MGGQGRGPGDGARAEGLGGRTGKAGGGTFSHRLPGARQDGSPWAWDGRGRGRPAGRAGRLGAGQLENARGSRARQRAAQSCGAPGGRSWGGGQARAGLGARPRASRSPACFLGSGRARAPLPAVSPGRGAGAQLRSPQACFLAGGCPRARCLLEGARGVVAELGRPPQASRGPACFLGSGVGQPAPDRRGRARAPCQAPCLLLFTAPGLSSRRPALSPRGGLRWPRCLRAPLESRGVGTRLVRPPGRTVLPPCLLYRMGLVRDPGACPAPCLLPIAGGVGRGLSGLPHPCFARRGLGRSLRACYRRRGVVPGAGASRHPSRRLLYSRGGAQLPSPALRAAPGTRSLGAACGASRGRPMPASQSRGPRPWGPPRAPRWGRTGAPSLLPIAGAERAAPPSRSPGPRQSWAPSEGESAAQLANAAPSPAPDSCAPAGRACFIPPGGGAGAPAPYRRAVGLLSEPGGVRSRP